MAENNLIFIDSNYIIALFNPLDSLHKDALAVSLMLAEENRGAIISNFIFAETATVLAQKRGKDIALSAGDYLLSGSARLIHVDEELQKKSWDIFHDIAVKNMSFVDCSILAVLQSEGIPRFLTFDKKDFGPVCKQYRFSFYE